MRYPGGKAKCFQHIINLIPPHDVYIEAFLGAAAVMRAKTPAGKEIGIDLDSRALACVALDNRSVELIQEDSIQFLKRYSFTGSEVVYCDPPYMPSTRKRNNIYRYEMDEAGHRNLLHLLQTINAKILISGYDNPLYQVELRGWNVYKFQAKSHIGLREETIWYNFPKPTILHDYQYLGANFRDRQTIKRRIDRIKKRISELTHQEQSLLHEWLSDNNRHANAT